MTEPLPGRNVGSDRDDWVFARHSGQLCRCAERRSRDCDGHVWEGIDRPVTDSLSKPGRYCWRVWFKSLSDEHRLHLRELVDMANEGRNNLNREARRG